MTPTIPSAAELRLVMPEIWLTVTMCAVLIVPFIRRSSTMLPTLTAVAGLLMALISAVVSLNATEGPSSVFHGMLAIDYFSQFFKILLIVFTMLIVVQWMLIGRDRTHPFDLPDFLCLVLGGALGMSLMSSAANLVMIFIATETASLPSYSLAGFRKRTRVGSEGSLKYVLFGSAASAVMLYGMSLIYGSTGSLDLQQIAWHAATHGVSPIFAVGVMALLVGFAFKLSAVPLHFWCPDVFQGAPTEVTTFLSVASKGAAILMLFRLMSAFGSVENAGERFAGLAAGVAILGAVTATWGNLVALHQTNIKRLLAYSSIAHAGYMIMACSVVVLVGPGTPTAKLAGAILFYILVYTFMNLGAFTIAGLVANATGSEDIRDLADLKRRSPALAVLLTLFLLSLFGMPGLGGFMSKVLLMVAMSEAGFAGFVLIAVLLLNTLLSLYYYMRPVYYMFFVPDSENRPVIAPHTAALAVLGLCAAMLIWTGLFSDFAATVTRERGAVSVTPGQGGVVTHLSAHVP